MIPTTPFLRAALSLFLLALLAAAPASAADKREKIAVMKVEAPTLNREEVSSLRDRLEVGVTGAVGTRLQVITKDSAAASVGGGDKLVACMEGASCDAEIGGALGVDYFVSASVRRTKLGVELGVTLLRIGRDVSLLRKDVKVFRSVEELLDGTSAHAEVVTRTALGGVLGRPAPAGGGTFSETAKEIGGAGADEVVVAFESMPGGAVVQVDGQLLCSATPCKKRLPVGGHEAIFQKERYAQSVQRFGAAKGATVKATLAPRFGWVSVETEPAGVAVAIDGADAGRSPVAWREVDEGTAEVAIADPCWLRAGERIAVRAGERRTVKLSAKPRLAGLKVDAEDEKGNAVEADVTVDGAVAGPVGATLKVPVCSKKVSVPLGNETFEEELRLKEGKIATVVAKPNSAVPIRGTPAEAFYAALEKAIDEFQPRCKAADVGAQIDFQAFPALFAGGHRVDIDLTSKVTGTEARVGEETVRLGCGMRCTASSCFAPDPKVIGFAGPTPKWAGATGGIGKANVEMDAKFLDLADEKRSRYSYTGKACYAAVNQRPFLDRHCAPRERWGTIVSDIDTGVKVYFRGLTSGAPLAFTCILNCACGQGEYCRVEVRPLVAGNVPPLPTGRPAVAGFQLVEGAWREVSPSILVKQVKMKMK